jgi:hypothetical protein
LPSRVSVRTRSSTNKVEISFYPCEVSAIVSFAKQASDPPGPQAAQHIPKRIGFQERGAQAATQAVHAPGAKGPD